MDSLEADLQNATENYNAVVQNFDEKSIKETLQRENSNKKELNNQLNGIDHEINFLNKQSSQQAELELHQNSLQKKEEDISVLRNKNESNLNLLFSNAIPQQKLKDNLEKIQKSLVTMYFYLLKYKNISFIYIIYSMNIFSLLKRQIYSNKLRKGNKNILHLKQH